MAFFASAATKEARGRVECALYANTPIVRQTCVMKRELRIPSRPRALLRFALSMALAIALFCGSKTARAQAGEGVDLSTPRRAMTTFVDAAQHGEWDTAALVVDARLLPGRPDPVKSALARELYMVLNHTVFLELDDLSDDPKGNLADGEYTEHVAAVRLGGRDVPILLARTKAEPARWAFTTSTLSRVPELFEVHGPSVFETSVPPVLRKTTLGLPRWQWMGLVLAAILANIASRVVVFVLGKVLGRITKRTQAKWDDELLVQLRSPARLLFTAVGFYGAVQLISLTVVPELVVIRLVTTLVIAAVTWMLFGVVAVISNIVEARAVNESEQSLTRGFRARGVRTQVSVLRRVINMALAACALALMLTQFETVRAFGVSLLASAGVAGIVLGLAAQRTIGSLFAGIQLSITQPIRLGDSVVVENEFGTIEEVTLTYVVVKVWDERRLIVPMTRFLEQPFQNWTKVGTQLHGTVMLYADWGLPIDALRQEVDRLVVNNPRWDKRTKKVQVTDAKEKTIEIRVLVSAVNADVLSDFRHELREKLVAWIATYEKGIYLPVSRGLDLAPTPTT